MCLDTQNGISVHVTLSYVKIVLTKTEVKNQGEIIFQISEATGYVHSITE